MLQFTTSWCGVCRKEMPFIEKKKDIYVKHKQCFPLRFMELTVTSPLERGKPSPNRQEDLSVRT